MTPSASPRITRICGAWWHRRESPEASSQCASHSPHSWTAFEGTPVEGGLSQGEAAESEHSSHVLGRWCGAGEGMDCDTQVARLFPHDACADAETTTRVAGEQSIQRASSMRWMDTNSLQAVPARLMIIAYPSAADGPSSCTSKDCEGSGICEHKQTPMQHLQGVWREPDGQIYTRSMSTIKRIITPRIRTNIYVLL